MPIELVTKYLPFVDEMFSTESKVHLLTNKDFSWEGANAVKIYTIGTASMTDYGRAGPSSGNWSRYGTVQNLEAGTEVFIVKKDRSFTFVIDKLDEDETATQLSAASALARQLRQVVIPEVDGWIYQQMCENAGNTPNALALTPANIYGEIIKGTNALDNAEVPDTGRVLLITPDTYLLMKQSPDIIMETDIAQNMRLRGVIANLDGMAIIRVPASRFPEGFGFMLTHPVATVAPTKLADYKVHADPPGVSGSLIEGRIAYDAFVLENKAKAIYYQATE